MKGTTQTLFLWRTRSSEASHGREKPSLKGAIYAGSAHHARLALRQQGVRVQRIRRIRGRASESEKSLFMRQLAMLCAAQVPLHRALGILKEGACGARKWPMLALIQVLEESVASGKPLHHGFTKMQTHWSALHSSLVQAGEASGTLPTMLAQLADYMEQKNSLHRALRSAAIYPVTVLVVSAILMAVFVGFIIPTFAAMYEDAKASLPLATRIALGLSERLQVWLPYIAALFVVLGVGALWIRSSQRAELQALHLSFSRWLLTLPILGRVLQKAAVARWAQSNSVMLSAGLPLTQALPIAAASTQRYAYLRATESLLEAIAAGKPLSASMAQCAPLFDAGALQMVSVGEETGELSHLLAKLAELYAAEVKEAIEHANKLLQPAIVLFLGLVISGILLALYLPIFQIGQVI